MSVKHIAIFGRRNAGKSSLLNNIVGQEISIISDIPGTTTDPVRKRIEIFGIGPVQLIDTAGIDDSGELGDARTEKSKSLVDKIDAAIVVFTDNLFEKPEQDIVNLLIDADVPILLVHNKSDINPLDEELAMELTESYKIDTLEYTTHPTDDKMKESNLSLLISFLVKIVNDSPYIEHGMFDGLVENEEKVILVCPIDSETPEGRLILPQVMAIRDLLDKSAIAIVQKSQTLEKYLKDNSSSIKMVVTDSQEFRTVAQIVPDSMALTSFSILLAKSKGCFEDYLKGTPKLSRLKEGDRILILESCTHHTSCEDIGRVKLPTMIKKFTGKNILFDVVAGLEKIERPIDNYAMVIQCGGCMITKRQLRNRLKPAIDQGVAVSNYGMTISYLNGIFDRAVSMFTEKED